MTSSLLAMLPTLAADPLEHVIDKPLIEGNLGLGHGWLVSNVTVMLIASGIVTLLILIPAARRIATGTSKTVDDYRAQGLMANLVEVICIYMRDETFKPILKEQCDKYTPFLWTMFWFILVCNVLGLIPFTDATAMMGINHGHGIGGTATQSIWVTGALAFISFLLVNVAGLATDWKGYIKHLTAGTPWFLWPLMIPIELMGIFVKPFALTMRLFANMTGGHVVIAVLLSFVPALISAFGTGAGGAIGLLPMLGVTALYFLEVLVAFIQAFVFTFLTCLFLGQVVVHEHEEGHHAEHHEAGHKAH